MKTENNTDLLIINPGNRKQVYQSLGESLAAAEPPVWAALMATFVRNKGDNTIYLVDKHLSGIFSRPIEEWLKKEEEKQETEK